MTPRIKRGPPPAIHLTRNNYRAASLHALRRDFRDRCAYSMIHTQNAGGLACMEIDHFDPRHKMDPTFNYTNLFLASRHCHLAKASFWPSEEQQELGIRLLDPCVEQDYGIHIFEDPTTHYLVGITLAGRTQIRRLDLNAPHLVRERKLRSELHNQLAKIKAEAESKRLKLPTEMLQHFEPMLTLLIPPIPPPPTSVSVLKI